MKSDDISGQKLTLQSEINSNFHTFFILTPVVSYYKCDCVLAKERGFFSKDRTFPATSQMQSLVPCKMRLFLVGKLKSRAGNSWSLFKEVIVFSSNSAVETNSPSYFLRCTIKSILSSRGDTWQQM